MDLYIGKKFKETFPNKKFYKITNESEKHYDHQYTDGLNCDSNKLRAITCSNGLYFTNKENLLYWIEQKFNGSCAKYLREVEILDDSIVCVEDEKNGKFKTDMFFLHKRTEISDCDVWNDLEFCKMALKKDKKYMTYIKNTSDEIYLELLSLGYVTDVVDIQNRSLALKMSILKNFPGKFKDMNDQTLELCNLAVKLDNSNIQYVDEQTLEQCWISLRKNPYNFKYIKYPTIEMTIFALVCNPNNICYVKNKTEDLTNLILQLSKESDDNALNVNNIDQNIYDENEFMSTIKDYLKKIEHAIGKMNKKKLTLELFDCIISNLQILKKYDNFRIGVINKLKEFKKDGDYLDFEANYYLNEINNYCN